MSLSSLINNHNNVKKSYESDLLSKATVDISSELEKDVAFVHVEITSRRVKNEKKLLGFISTYHKIPVFRLVFRIMGVGKLIEDYEEYYTHKEIYSRIATQKLHGVKFPGCISINEFIDKGFTVKLD